MRNFARLAQSAQEKGRQAMEGARAGLAQFFARERRRRKETRSKRARERFSRALRQGSDPGKRLLEEMVNRLGLGVFALNESLGRKKERVAQKLLELGARPVWAPEIPKREQAWEAYALREPLALALEKGASRELVKNLLERGAQSARDSSGMSALLWAARSGRGAGYLELLDGFGQLASMDNEEVALLGLVCCKEGNLEGFDFLARKTEADWGGGDGAQRWRSQRSFRWLAEGDWEAAPVMVAGAEKKEPEDGWPWKSQEEKKALAARSFWRSISKKSMREKLGLDWTEVGVSSGQERCMRALDAWIEKMVLGSVMGAKREAQDSKGRRL